MRFWWFKCWTVYKTLSTSRWTTDSFEHTAAHVWHYYSWLQILRFRGGYQATGTDTSQGSIDYRLSFNKILREWRFRRHHLQSYAKADLSLHIVRGQAARLDSCWIVRGNSCHIIKTKQDSIVAVLHLLQKTQTLQKCRGVDQSNCHGTTEDVRKCKLWPIWCSCSDCYVIISHPSLLEIIGRY